MQVYLLYFCGSVKVMLLEPPQSENRDARKKKKKKKKKKNLFPLVTLTVAGETICFVVGNRGLSSGAQMG